MHKPPLVLTPSFEVFPDKRIMLTADEVGDLLGLSRATVAQQIIRGILQSVYVGRRRLVPASAIRELASRKLENSHE